MLRCRPDKAKMKTMTRNKSLVALVDLATGATSRKINLDFATNKTVNKGRSWTRRSAGKLQSSASPWWEQEKQSREVGRKGMNAHEALRLLLISSTRCCAHTPQVLSP